MLRLPSCSFGSRAHLLAVGLSCIALYATACGDSSDSDDGAGGGAGGSSSGKGGSGGSVAQGGSGGKGGSGGASGQGGSAGKGGSAGASGAAVGGAGVAGEAGGAGAPGGAAGEAGDSGAGGEGGDGSVSGSTCATILADNSSAPSGVYSIDPPGNDGAPFAVVCDMTTGGGGWTLAFLKNSVHNGGYADFGAAYQDVGALATAPDAASSSTEALAGWVNLNTFPYSHLKLAGYRNGSEFYASEPIAKSTLRLMFGQNGYFLYNDLNGYYWCGGDNAYTTNGTGQEDQPKGAPDDCKGHTSLGDGWDFSTTDSANQGLTICGGGSVLMTAGPASGFITYGSPGAAQAIWVR